MKKHVLSLGSLFLGLSAFAAAPAIDAALLAATTPRAFTNLAGEVMLYREAVPQNVARPAPLVVFLHGAGERGSDNRAQLVHCVGPILDYFARRHEPVRLIAPQCEKDRRWVEVDWSAAAHRLPALPSKMMRLALQLTEKTLREPGVDPARVYVAGISMGGYGTWDAICRRPDLFAAAMPVCGGGDPHQVARLKDLPILVAHGDMDQAVPTSRSREMVAALQLVNAPVRYMEYPKCGHNCWTAAFADSGLLDWFFAHRRPDALPRAAYLTQRTDEPFAWDVAPDDLTPAAYLERLRAVGGQLRRACPQAKPICRRDQVSADFAKALDAFGEGEEYFYRDGAAAKAALSGTLASPLLCAGYGRAYLLGTDGAEIASWEGCGNIHRAVKTTDHIWWSNGRVWRVPLAGGAPELVYRSPQEVGGGVLGFTVEPDGAVVMAVNATHEIIELAPPADFPANAPRRVRTRFKVDCRDAKGAEPGPHGALRMIRKTAAGTYLVCVSSAAKVAEYERAGKLVWEQAAPPFAFDCLRRANGNTLVSHLDGVTEFTPDHQIAWQIKTTDFPELKLAYLCGLQELPNGNLVVGTWANGSPARTNTTAFEVTRDKRIVWAHRSADANMMSAIRVD